MNNVNNIQYKKAYNILKELVMMIQYQETDLEITALIKKAKKIIMKEIERTKNKKAPVKN